MRQVLQFLAAGIGVGGIPTAYVLWRKAKPEVDQIVVSAAQGAVVIQTQVLDTLYDELRRSATRMDDLERAMEQLRLKNREQEQNIAALITTNADLMQQNAALMQQVESQATGDHSG